MKSKPIFTRVLSISAIVVTGFMLALSSCKKDDAVKPAPTLSLSSTSASNTAGSQVSTVVTVNSPEGGKTLAITVNGVADASLPDVTLDGTTAQDVPVNFTIPANAAVGFAYNITFVATDKKNQVSTPSAFAVVVTAIPSKQIVEVTANITADTHWTADKIYRLNGFIRVGEDVKVGGATTPTITAGKTATLTIDAGTVIYGKKGTPGGALIVQRGSKVIAVGTAVKPIVFTSDQPAGQRVGGDWAGIVICGQSANNIKGSTGTDGIAELEGAYGAFHGGGASPISTDNSGTLQYVRIEFAGYPINPNQELNGLTFGSVGSGTIIDHVQVTYANDDSYEWFGGTVNVKNIIAYKGIDDDFDTDNGFSGAVQFGLGIRDALIADQSESNGFEADNDGSGSANLPYTSPIFSNMTLIGPKATSGTTVNALFGSAAHLRRNLKQKIYNSFFTGYPTAIFIDGTNGAPTGTDDAVVHANDGSLVLKNNILAGVDKWGGNGYGTATTSGTSTASVPDENAISGLPFTVEQTPGVVGTPTGNFNHPNAPRGRIVSAGNIASGSNPWVNGVFGATPATITERTINSVNALPWFLSNNTGVAKWTDPTVGININVFEPKNGTPTLIPTGTLLTSGALFTDSNISGNSFIDKTITYRGAFGATDWTTGWVNWNPQVTDYSK
jgi:hypothetical protein